MKNSCFPCLVKIFSSAGFETLDSAGKIFYRLWNPYLKHIPKTTLNECFPSSSQGQQKLRVKLGYLIFDKDFEKIEAMIGGYKFQNRNLLEQALTHRSARFYACDVNVGDSTKFEFIFLKLFGLELQYKKFNSANESLITCLIALLVIMQEGEFPMKYYARSPNEKDYKYKPFLAQFSVFGALFVDNPGGWVEKYKQIQCCWEKCISKYKQGSL